MKIYCNRIFLLVPLVAVFFITGCTTKFSSLSDNSMSGEIFVGDRNQIISVIDASIKSEFPAADVQKTSSTSFSWYYQPFLDRITFRLDVYTAKGQDGLGKTVQGWYYTLGSLGTQSFPETRFINPLKEKIKTALAEKNIIQITVKNIENYNAANIGNDGTDKVKQCFTEITSDLALNPIRDKISLSGEANQSFGVLINTTKPSSEEKNAIQKWGLARDKCLELQRLSNSANNVSPSIIALIQSHSNNQQSLIAQLYLGSMSYGEFASKRQVLYDTTNEAIIRIQSELERQDELSRQRASQLALQAEQNMISALNGFSQSMQMQNQANLMQNQMMMQTLTHSRQMSMCNFIGNTLFCN
jgi:hypothetical protein